MAIDNIEAAALRLPRNAIIQADSDAALASGKNVLDIEQQALASVRDSLGSDFVQAVELISKVEGRVVVTGMGKSGHVARKIAATLASTGTPAMFVHPGEASHGDLGMVTELDVVLALSNSGEVPELRDIMIFTRRYNIPLIAMTGKPKSTLATNADIALVLPQIKAASPLELAPTTTTTSMIAQGDALAVALYTLAGFTATDFAVFHPGGKLGSRLMRVEQIMRSGDDLPLVRLGTSLRDALLVMTRKCLGCVGVVSDEGHLAGILTDGDLRRHIHDDLLDMIVDDIMTSEPITIPRKSLAAEALAIMNKRSVTILFVIENREPVGAIHLHDCLRAGIA